MNFKDPEGQHARWMDVLSTYDFNIEHRPGRLHGNADGLSRTPCKQCKVCHIPNNTVSVLKVEVGDELTLRKPLKCLQDEDREIRKVKNWLLHNKQPKNDKISAESVTVKSLCAQWKRLILDNGMLYRKWTDQVTGKDIASNCSK